MADLAMLLCGLALLVLGARWLYLIATPGCGACRAEADGWRVPCELHDCERGER